MEPEQQFLDYVIKAIVDHPEAVVIERTVDNMGVFLTLTVHPDDMGKVIGKQGKIAQEALRPLLRVVGMKHNARVTLKINEPVGGKRMQSNGDSTILEEMDKTIEELKD